MEKKHSKKKKHKDGAKNGLIPTSSRLSCVLRHFAGGSAYDIFVIHRLSHSEVFSSIWNVVDAVNKYPKLAFYYLESHDKQREIARSFRLKSKPGFACCGGAIDVLLFWVECPSEIEYEKANCGSIKFFCGRKHKFGLNL